MELNIIILLAVLPVIVFNHPVEVRDVCYFTKIEKHALYGQNTKVVNGVSLEQCRKECMDLGDTCASFDYNYGTDSCFMSDQTKDSEPGMFGGHINMDYFQKVSCTIITVKMNILDILMKKYSLQLLLDTRKT